MKKLLVALAIGLSIGVAAGGQRLPQTVVPETYDLKFEPNLEKATFGCEETIAVKLLKPAKTVTLNSAELELQDVIITAGGDTQKATASLDAEKEQAVLTVAKELPAGPAEIRIRFTGILNDKLRAFYLSRSAPKIRRDAVRSDRCTSRVPMLR